MRAPRRAALALVRSVRLAPLSRSIGRARSIARARSIGRVRSIGSTRSLGVAAMIVLGVGASAPSYAGEAYLGIYAKSNANVLEASNAIDGITVTRVVENSPAASAGIRAGDVLLAANDEPMGHPDALADLEDRTAVGAAVVLRIERDQQLIERTLTAVPRLPAPQSEPPPVAEAPSSRTFIERRHLGVAVRDADPSRLAELGESERFGVEITLIAARSPLRDLGVAAGDLALAIDGERIPSAQELIEYLEPPTAGPRFELSLVARDGSRRTVTVPGYRPEKKLLGLKLLPLVSIERGAEVSEYSFLLGAFSWTRLLTGSRVRLLWLVSWETGSNDELLEVEGGR